MFLGPTEDGIPSLALSISRTFSRVRLRRFIVRRVVRFPRRLARSRALTSRLTARNVTASDGHTSHRHTAVMFLFGTCPTGMRVTSRRDATSTTDTEFEPAFATYTDLESGVNVSQSG